MKSGRSLHTPDEKLLVPTLKPLLIIGCAPSTRKPQAQSVTGKHVLLHWTWMPTFTVQSCEFSTNVLVSGLDRADLEHTRPQ